MGMEGHADRQGRGAVTFPLGCLRGDSLGSGVISKMVVITGSKTFHSVTISPRGGADKITPGLQMRKWTAGKRGDLPKATEPVHYSGHSHHLAPFAGWLKPWVTEAAEEQDLAWGFLEPASMSRAPGPARRHWVSQWEGSQLTAP